MADDEIENILCSVCISKKDYDLDDEQYFIYEINEDVDNVEDICIECIKTIFNRYFYKNQEKDELCFNIIMKSKSIIEKLTKICSSSSGLLYAAFINNNFDFAEMLIEECDVDYNKFNVSLSRFDGNENITEINNNKFLNIIADSPLDNKIEAIKLLIDHGADIEHKDVYGYTFDHYLNSDEKIEIMEFIEYLKLGGRRTSLNLKPARK
jgi:hypothetical protein